jgi:ATP-dependent helicase/nuclease subunit B
MLNLILGRPGTGKTNKIYNLIKEKVTQNRQIILFVPEQSSFENERGLLDFLGEKNFSRVNLLTFSHLSAFFYEKTGQNTISTALSGSKKNILMSFAIENCKEKLCIFNKNSSENIKILCKTMNEFKNFGVKIDEQSNLVDKIKNQSIKRKLVESLIIFEEFNKILDKKFINPLKELDILCDKIEKKKFFSDYDVFFDEFSNFSKPQMRILNLAILQTDVFAAFKCDDFEANEFGIGTFYAKNTVKKLIESFKYNKIILKNNYRFKNEEFKILADETDRLCINGQDNVENDVRSVENIFLYKAGDIYDECDFVAREIRKYVIENNARYSDFTVITRDIAGYGCILSQSFVKYEIPFFIDFPEDIFSKNLIIFVLSVLDIATYGFECKYVFRWLKTGMTEFSTEDIALIENYCFTWNIAPADWRDGFKNSPLGLEKVTEDAVLELVKINKIREKMIKPFIDFYQKKYSVAKKFFEFLKETKVPERVREICGKFLKNGEIARAEEQARLWDILVKALEEVDDCLDGRNIDTEKFAGFLCAALEEADISFIPQGSDEVVVIAAERARSGKPKIVFIIGASRGDFPKSVESHGIFSNFERRELNRVGIGTWDMYSEIMARENFWAYQAITSASERLFVSFCANGGKFESEIFEKILKIFPKIKIVSYKDIPKKDFITAKKSAFEFFSAGMCPGLLSYFKSKVEFAERLTAVLCTANYKSRLQNAALKEKMFSFGITLSASQIEKYNSCPFGYFCEYILNIKKRELTEFKATHRGLLMHFLLERLFSADVQLGDEKLEMKIKNLIDEFANKFLGGSSGKSARFLHLLGRQAIPAKIIFKAARKMVENGAFKPFVHEMKILSEEKFMGKNLKVVGKVDRVDFCGDFWRILDYKTGTKKFDLSEVINGVGAQMLIYAKILSRKFARKKCAGVFYFPAIKPIINTENENEIIEKIISELRISGLFLDDEFVRESLKNEAVMNRKNAVNEEQIEIILSFSDYLIKDTARRIMDGEFERRPYENACDRCNYREICGFIGEIERTEKQKLDTKEIVEKMKDLLFA